MTDFGIPVVERFAPHKCVTIAASSHIGPSLMLQQRMHQLATAPAKMAQVRAESIVLGAAIAACAVLFAYLSVARHHGFHTSAYDLAMYDQAVWNTSQGRWFAINLLEDTMPGLTNKLGDHVEPILLPLALLYRIRSNADVLLAVQAMALAVLIWPLFHSVRWRSESVFLAALAVALYLIHPAMWNALLFDFHPAALGAAFLVFALWMMVQHRRVACVVFAVLAMACKEQVGLMVGMLGAYAVLFYKPERRLGLALIGIGLTWSIVAFAVIIPAFQPSGASYYLNRYGRLGGSAGEILLAPILKPDVVVSILTSPNRVSYYGNLLLPLGGLPLLGPEMLLPVLPDVLLNTFSAFRPARTLDAHYAVMIAPFLILAAMWGIDRLARWLQDKIDRRTVIGIATAWLLVFMAAYQIRQYQGFLPLSARYLPTYAPELRSATGLRLTAQIPVDAIVAAQFNLVPHVSQRQRAHVFPRIDDAEWVFLDTQGSLEPFESQGEYRAAVEALRRDPSFEVAGERDGFILFRRR
ncbi:MAG TPA: DUF2079 domain-containing protein [Anaerolineae bacterium]|nr:DUF2079 domain-containing protein [Anaerolineae bacterium]